MSALLSLLLSLVLGGPELSNVAWEPVPPRVSLLDVVDEPEVWLGERITFVGQVRGSLDTWEGFVTPFQPASHHGLSLWPDESLLWLREAYEAPGLPVFVRRGSRWADRATSLRPHARVLVTGRVRSCLGGRPWIEVERVLRTREHVPEGSVLHAIRAAELLRKGAVDLARAEAQRALTAPLPDAPRGHLEAFERSCGRLLGRLERGWRPAASELTRQHRAILALLQDGAPSAASASWRRRLRGVTPLGDPVR